MVNFINRFENPILVTINTEFKLHNILTQKLHQIRFGMTYLTSQTKVTKIYVDFRLQRFID